MRSDFHEANRERLAALADGSLIVISAYGLQQRSNDAAHSFTQEANFWYLTGINDPDWRVVIDASNGTNWLVEPNVSEAHRLFDGGISADEARTVSGIDTIIPADQFDSLLTTLSKKHSTVSTVGPPAHYEVFGFSLNPSIANTKRLLQQHFRTVRDVTKDLAKLRAIKQPVEIEAIRGAIDKTIVGFESVHSNLSKLDTEYAIEAELTYRMRGAGADGHAYDPIVAGGSNAITLHYSKNAEKIAKRELVLIDAGASYGGYAADITRTYSRGVATKRQQRVHAAVETAHHKIIALIQPMLSVHEYQDEVDKIMKAALDSIDLPSDDQSLRTYFPHAVSHGLGIDVHDSLGAPRYFETGMVLTVEPGIYIPQEGIGVRIEDDILVTEAGSENLSARLSTGL